MDLPIVIDVVVFFAFIAAVVSIGILKSRHEKDSEGYFLAGRGLMWWLIGFSLIAANISTEQFVGMSGQAANDDVGLAIASYEWIAAITLVIVAFFFLPKFLKSGIYTIPEFLEYRFNHFARTLMSLLMVVIYVAVTIAAVIYSGAKTAEVLFGNIEFMGVHLDVLTTSWIIGVLAAVYVAAGGLKACAWADLLQGSALILGGAIVVFFAMSALGKADPEVIGLAPGMADAGPIAKYWSLNHGKMHMALPPANTVLPCTALMLGIWVPNLYYWGLNQYIMQRTLGASSLGEGQKGVVFAAALKLVIPFIVVIPGIVAFNLYKSDMKEDARTTTNTDSLAKFDEVKDSPATAKTAFAFNRDFAQLYPAFAGELTSFNSQAAGVSAPPVDTSDTENPKEAAQSRVDANRVILADIGASNSTLAVDEQIAVQKELIGYEYDSAFGLLIKKLIPPGLRGFMLAAILGAVISSLASMLNAASTIFTMDIYKEYVNRNASQPALVAVGRTCVVVFVVIGCLIAPALGHPAFKGIFTYIQSFQGFIWPGVLAIFIFGMFVPRAPRACGWVGLLLGPILYGLLKYAATFDLPDWTMLFVGNFLNQAAVAFVILVAVLGIMTVVNPLKEPVTLPEQTKIDLKSSQLAKGIGIVVVILTVALYVIFW